MDKVRAYKDFLTPEEAKELTQWTESNYHKDWFMDPRMDSKGLKDTKLTTRFANPLVNYQNPLIDPSNMDHSQCVVASSPDFEYPKLCYDIQNRIVNTFGFKDFGCSPVGKDGIITEISFKGGTIHPHTDPPWFEGTNTVHCNFITQKPDSGGVTYIDGEPWETEETDLLMYIVSQAEHGVDEIIGDKHRVLWIFSFMLSQQDTLNVYS